MFALVLSAAVPTAVPAQTADSSAVASRETLFSVQPWTAGQQGLGLELERSVTRRFAVVIGSALTFHDRVYSGRPLFSSANVGARYYASGRGFRGAFAGVHVGYDRQITDYSGIRREWSRRAIVGATAGYDFVVFRRIVIGPGIGLDYGRPSRIGAVQSFNLMPRLGIGINFE